jgi:hypothetical protein
MAAAELVTCGQCSLLHVVVEVRMARCPCRGTGLTLADGIPVYPFRPCDHCPGDGQIATFDELSVTAQERACRHAALTLTRQSAGAAA